ncbi:unnamed protein product, partial [Closterium sp. Naga37s-1]
FRRHSLPPFPLPPTAFRRQSLPVLPLPPTATVDVSAPGSRDEAAWRGRATGKAVAGRGADGG